MSKRAINYAKSSVPRFQDFFFETIVWIFTPKKKELAEKPIMQNSRNMIASENVYFNFGRVEIKKKTEMD